VSSGGGNNREELLEIRYVSFFSALFNFLGERVVIFTVGATKELILNAATFTSRFLRRLVDFAVCFALAVASD